MACDLTLSYDENLMDNLFFQKLQKEFKELFLKAISEGCIICVPRAGSLPKYPLNLEDFLTHILVPVDELPESHFRSLCGFEIKINNKIIKIDFETGKQCHVYILFQETFYTKEGLKYMVLCTEQPLDGGKSFSQNKSITAVPKNLRDCLDLLWNECGTHELIESMDKEIGDFLKKYSTVDATDTQFIRDSIYSLYSKCLQTFLKNPNIKTKTTSQKHMLKNVRIAVEAYIQHGTYKKIIKDISTSTAADDAQLNKIIRNFSDLHFKDFKIKTKFYTCIPKARLELSRINGYSTTLGKIECLRRTICALSEPQSSKSALITDDLLQLLAFLIIKTNLPNWNAQLLFLKIFQFSDFSNFNENNFFVTSLEAAIAYVQSEIFYSLDGQAKIGFEDNLKNHGKELLSSSEKTSIKEKTIYDFFHDIALGDLEKVKEVLETQQLHINNYSSLNLCHPLCNCEKCSFLIHKNLCESSPTINSCDDQGQTALHIAAMYGVPNIIEYLLANKADPNAGDYDGRTPVHYAALRGHQNALLLLIHNSANINAMDNFSNIPLHLCVDNGHESCVKALIYFSEHLGIKLQINQKNSRGDTPLHSASKWGYLNIVKILLEYGADPTILNKRKFSAIDYAHNVKIFQLLKQKCQVIDNYIKIKPLNPVLDLCDQNEKLLNQLYKGVQAHSVDTIKKVKKVLKAVENGDVNLVSFYLGIDVTEFEENQNIFDPAEESGQEKKCHPLCMCPKCKLHENDRNEKLKETKQIKKKGLTVNVCNSEGCTPLHIASRYGHLDLVRGFIRNGALLNAQTNGLVTPLMLACENQNHKVVKELLDSGCHIDLQDCRMNTALHYACNTGCMKLVEILLKYEPNIALKNDEHKTALKIATEKLSFGIVQLLNKGKPFNLDDC